MKRKSPGKCAVLWNCKTRVRVPSSTQPVLSTCQRTVSALWGFPPPVVCPPCSEAALPWVGSLRPQRTACERLSLVTWQGLSSEDCFTQERLKGSTWLCVSLCYPWNETDFQSYFRSKKYAFFLEVSWITLSGKTSPLAASEWLIWNEPLKALECLLVCDINTQKTDTHPLFDDAWQARCWHTAETQGRSPPLEGRRSWG